MIRTCMRSALKPKALAAELTDLKVAAQFVTPMVTAIEQGYYPPTLSAFASSPPGRLPLVAPASAPT